MKIRPCVICQSEVRYDFQWRPKPRYHEDLYCDNCWDKFRSTHESNGAFKQYSRMSTGSELVEFISVAPSELLKL